MTKGSRNFPRPYAAVERIGEEGQENRLLKAPFQTSLTSTQTMNGRNIPESKGRREGITETEEG